MALRETCIVLGTLTSALTWIFSLPQITLLD